MNPKIQPTFMDYFKATAVKEGVNTAMNVAARGEDPSQAIVNGITNTVVNSAAALAASKVGDAGVKGKMTPTQQDGAHTVIGFIAGGVKNLDNPWEGACHGCA